MVACTPPPRPPPTPPVNPRTLRHLFNFWPPFLATGVHVSHISSDWRHARVELRMRPWNRNYVGTHFGGSLFSMTDPFWMIMVMQCLGRDYIVWDKAAEIEFVKPGKGTVQVQFKLDQAVLDELTEATASGQKVLRWFPMDVVDAQGDVVARLRKQLYVRRKRKAGGSDSQDAAVHP